MTMARREWITIVLGGAAVLAAGLLRFGPSLTGGSGGELSSLLTQAQEYGRVRAAVTMMTEDLGVEIPRADLAAQEGRMRERLMQVAGQSGVQLGTLKRAVRRARPGSASEGDVQFQFDLQGNFAGVVKFIDSLEHDVVPFLIEDFSIQQAQGGEGGSGNQPPTGRIKATMTVKGTLFARTFPPPAQPKADQAPSGAPTPAAEPTPGGEPTPPPAEGSPTPTPAATGATPEATPAPTPAAETGSADRPRRKIIRFEGKEVIIEGNTVTVNGEVVPATPEQIEEGLKKLPPGAEVIEE